MSKTSELDRFILDALAVGKYEVKENGDVIGPRGKINGGVSKGYRQVSVYHNGMQRTCKVHRMVALAFLPKPEGKDQINHKDGDKLNNKIENIEWVTPSENSLHSVRMGLHTPPRNNGLVTRSTMTEEDVLRVLDLRFLDGLSIPKISEVTGWSIANIGRICKGETWNKIYNAYPCKRYVRGNNTSGYVGVMKSIQGKPWRAAISVDGKAIHLGQFDTPQDAADAYDKAALKYHGEFARTNAMIRAEREKDEAA